MTFVRPLCELLDLKLSLACSKNVDLGIGFWLSMRLGCLYPISDLTRFETLLYPEFEIRTHHEEAEIDANA